MEGTKTSEDLSGEKRAADARLERDAVAVLHAILRVGRDMKTKSRTLRLGVEVFKTELDERA